MCIRDRCYGREVVRIEIRAGTETVKIWCGAEWMRFVELSSTWAQRLVRMKCYLGRRGSPVGRRCDQVELSSTKRIHSAPHQILTVSVPARISIRTTSRP